MGRLGAYGATAPLNRFIEVSAGILMSMPSGKQSESGPFARAISAEIRAVMARHRVTMTLLADRAGMSRGYLGKRLRDEVAFTLNDVEAMCEAMREDLPGLMQAAFERMQANEKEPPPE